MGVGLFLHTVVLAAATASLILAVHENMFDFEVKDFKSIDLSFFEKKIKPVNRNAVPFETPIALSINNGGRFGNSVVQLYRAIRTCRLLNCKVIQTNYRQEFFLDRDIDYDWFKIKRRVENPREFTIFRNDFWDEIMDYENNSVADVRFVSDQLQKHLPESKLRKPVVDPNAIYAQIRSGDVFCGHYIAHEYGQPPMCYIELAASKRNYSQKIIIAEDGCNPVINELMKKGWKWERRPLKDDLYILTHAQHLVLTRGTFGFVTGLLNVNESPEIFSFMEDPAGGNEKGFTHYYYPEQDYYDRVMKDWKANEEQKKLILEYKCHDFEPRRQLWGLEKE